MADTWPLRRPLSRGDSSRSVRDSSYWLSLATSGSGGSGGGSSDRVRPVIRPISSASIQTIHDIEEYLLEPAALTSPPAPEGGICLPVRVKKPPPSVVSPSDRSSNGSRTARPSPVSSTTPMRERTEAPVVQEKQRPEEIVVVEQVLENQRYQMVLGWGAKGHLLPLDPDKFMRALRRPQRVMSAHGNEPTGLDQPQRRRSRRRSSGDKSMAVGDENGDVEWIHSPVFPDIPLPELQPSYRSSYGSTDDETDESNQDWAWQWSSPWHLDMTDVQDPDGWQYGSSFHNFQPTPLGASIPVASAMPMTACDPLMASVMWRPKHTYVRRRKWIRVRRLCDRHVAATLHATASSTDMVSAFDDSFLDCISGWMRKLGHRRKNWKLRFFVLEKSILRYYSDAQRSRLKGEVLLFHPATRVHCVDIHLTGGRDHCFAIHVGAGYTLLLQTNQLSERENWMYCIEDALLCRDSYQADPRRGVDKLELQRRLEFRESVAQRRSLSVESMIFTTNARSTGLTPLHVFAAAGGDEASEDDTNGNGTALRGTTMNAQLKRMLVASDAFLNSSRMKSFVNSFIDKFTRKYAPQGSSAAACVGGGGVPGCVSGNDQVRETLQRERQPSRTSSTSRSSLLMSPMVSPGHLLQDARSLLALKNYRFFLEQALDKVLTHLHRLQRSENAPPTPPITSPKASSPPPLERMSTSWSFNEDEDQWAVLRKAVQFKLERQTFIALQDIIYALLERNLAPQEVANFERNRAFLGSQPQQYLEIPASHASPSDWSRAVHLLSRMDNFSLPSEKAGVLVAVAQCIFETHAREHSTEGTGGGVSPMAADDFLPIFIFVLSRCHLRHVVLTQQVISETMAAHATLGETGYYATMLEAAVAYIASVETATGG